MGGQSSKNSTQEQVTIVPGLDADTFILIDCDGTENLYHKDDLKSLADFVGVTYTEGEQFAPVCKRIRSKIMQNNQNEVHALDEKIPPLSASVFDNKTCDEITREYTANDFRDFINSKRQDIGFQSKEALEFLDKNKNSVNGFKKSCQITRLGLINKNLIKPTEDEISLFAKRDQFADFVRKNNLQKTLELTKAELNKSS